MEDIKYPEEVRRNHWEYLLGDQLVAPHNNADTASVGDPDKKCDIIDNPENAASAK